MANDSRDLLREQNQKIDKYRSQLINLDNVNGSLQIRIVELEDKINSGFEKVEKKLERINYLCDVINKKQPLSKTKAELKEEVVSKHNELSNKINDSEKDVTSTIKKIKSELISEINSIKMQSGLPASSSKSSTKKKNKEKINSSLSNIESKGDIGGAQFIPDVYRPPTTSFPIETDSSAKLAGTILGDYRPQNSEVVLKWNIENLRFLYNQAVTFERYECITSDTGLYDDEGYMFRLQAQLNGGRGYWSWNRYLCVGLMITKDHVNQSLSWPVKRNFKVSLIDRHDRRNCVSKKRERLFKKPGEVEWVFNFCELDDAFGPVRNFNTTFVENDSLLIELEFFDFSTGRPVCIRT